MISAVWILRRTSGGQTRPDRPSRTVALLTRMKAWERVICVIAAVLMIAPEIVSTIVGVAIVVPVVLRQLAARRREMSAAAA